MLIKQSFLLLCLSACPVCYLPVEEAVALMPNAPSFSPLLKHLTYIHEENLSISEFGGSEFGGYPSLRQRDDSYNIRESMSVHCGYEIPSLFSSSSYFVMKILFSILPSSC